MKNLLLIILFSIFASMKAKQKIDLLVYNATVYTVDQNFSKAESIAVDQRENNCNRKFKRTAKSI